MIRVAWVLAGALSLAVTEAPRPAIDAVTFALAFRVGDADRYRNTQVSGSGVTFHGALRERIADGSTRTSLVVTLGAADTSGQVTVLKTWDDFIAAERARTTIVVALSGPDLPEVGPQPAAIRFSGVYDGQVRTVMRPPQAGDAAPADSGPCPGEQARPPQPNASFYCAPLLTGATATVVRH
jgi:hypothetical protein